MKTYEHTQPATAIIVLISIAALVTLVIGLTVLRPLLWAVLVFIIIGWLFYSLTIDIADDELRWRFGSGVNRRRVRLADIDRTDRVRTMVLEGWAST